MRETDERDESDRQVSNAGLSRRAVLRGAVGGAAAIGLAGALAACGDSGDSSGPTSAAAPASSVEPVASAEPAASTAPATTSATTAASEPTASSAQSEATTAASGDPVTGGSLRVAMVSAGADATLDPANVLTLVAWARARSLFQPLADFTRPADDQNVLAESLEPNSDFTVWQVKLRPGVTFHDGKPLTSDDVLYSYRRLEELKAAYLPALDLARSKRVSDTELTFQLNYPVVDLVPAIFNGSNTFVVQDGAADFSNPVGTGPFKAKSYAAGQESVFVRYEDYWEDGKPYVDELRIQEISDPAARLNALLAGQVDAVSELDLRAAAGLAASGTDFSQSGLFESQEASVRILNGAAGQWVPLCMNIASPEFSDSRVRLAFKLAMDREACVQSALAGMGVVGNDVFGLGMPGYDSNLEQHAYDPEQARSLLKAAGKEGMKLEIRTAPAGTAFVEAVQVFASTAKAAGIDVTVKTGPADTYYTDVYQQVPLFQTQWTNASLLELAPSVLLGGAPYNGETNWKQPSWDERFAEAQGTSDPGLQQEILAELQGEQWAEGGYLLWGFANWVDGLGPNLQGVEPSSRIPLGAYQFENYWLQS